MVSITQQGLEDVFRFKIKAGLSLDFLPAKSINIGNEKSELFFSTTIAAMANSNGGQIFIGINSSRKIARSLDSLIDSTAIDWLQSICQNQIYPQIPNLSIEKILVSADSKQFVIGINVPNSHLAPHMSGDKHFYKRVETKSILLEEYEIRDLYIKGKRPEIELFSITNVNGIPILSAGKFKKLNFYPRFLVRNSGNAVEKFYKVELSVPTALNNPNFNQMADSFSRFEDNNSIYSFVGKNPLFQNEIATVIEPNFVLDAQSYPIFEQGEIELKLFYSSGVQSKKYHCKELLLYRNKQIELSDFSENQQVLVDVL